MPGDFIDCVTQSSQQHFGLSAAILIRGSRYSEMINTYPISKLVGFELYTLSSRLYVFTSL